MLEKFKKFLCINKYQFLHLARAIDAKNEIRCTKFCNFLTFKQKILNFV